MPITPRDQQDLARTFEEVRERLPGRRKEDAFPILYLGKKFKCARDEALARMNTEDRDVRFDAFHYDRDTRNFYVLACFWTDNHNALKEPLDWFASSGVELVFGNGPTKSAFVSRVRAEVNEYRSAIDRVYLQLVYKGATEAADSSQGLTDRRENLENKRHYLEQAFGGRPVEFHVELVGDRRSPPPPRPRDTHEVRFVDRATLEVEGDDHTLHVGFIRLMDLFRIYSELGVRFFDRNIRASLSADNAPNRKIREALTAIAIREQESPEVFVFNHNGVTLAAEHVQFGNESAVLKVPRLLNGAQTVSSLSQFLSDMGDSPTPPQPHLLERIMVIAKIVVGDPWSEFVTRVTISNNQQNPVESWNLRANDRIQCDLHDRFREELGIFYSRQENAFQGLSSEELDEYGIAEQNRDIKIRQLAQTFLAAQGEIVLMTHLPEVFEKQHHYEATFRKSYLLSDPRRIVLAYKAGLMINRVFPAMEERAGAWLVPAIRKSRSLIWALLIQGILNDDKVLDANLEAYGNTLTQEHSFGDYLKELASGRVLSALRESYSNDDSRKKIEAEKYTFTKTKEAYQRAMAFAAERFGWAKKQL